MHLMTNTMRSNTLSADDPGVVNFMVEDEANAEVRTPDCDSSEVMLTDKVDGRLNGIDPERTASFERALQSIKSRPEFQILATKVIVDAVDAT